MASSEQSFEYDVFLSHSSQDKAVVRDLAERLRSHGLNVWFDEWIIQPGDSIPSLIAQGLETSRILVLCMSGNACGSDWVTLEHQTMMFRDPMNKNRRFVPVRIDESPVRDILKQFAYVDWRQQDPHQYDQLLRSCQPKPTEIKANLKDDRTTESSIPKERPNFQNDRQTLSEDVIKTNEKFISGHTDYVRSVSLSADGTQALSGSSDKTVKLWEVPEDLGRPHG